MSDTIKRPYAHMHMIACGLVERLRPATLRIEIAGSLRRRKDMIGDIEIVATATPFTDLFGEPTGQTEVDLLLSSWPVAISKNGKKYKQFTFAGKDNHSYTVDLFLQPDPATWGINMMIRTGSAEFSKRMVSPRTQGGLMPDEYHVEGARVWCNGVALQTPEESDVFELWEMDFIELEKRGG